MPEESKKKPTPPSHTEQKDEARKVLQPIKQQNKYSADFDLISTFGPDTDPNQFSAAQVFQSFSKGTLEI